MLKSEGKITCTFASLPAPADEGLAQTKPDNAEDVCILSNRIYACPKSKAKTDLAIKIKRMIIPIKILPIFADILSLYTDRKHFCELM
jgi:hypothetical protein